MNIEQAKAAVEFDPESCAILKIRGENAFLPEYTTDGFVLQPDDWVLFDMSEKVDTGVYGAFYKIEFSEKNEVEKERIKQIAARRNSRFKRRF